jgi:hypothetical protein
MTAAMLAVTPLAERHRTPVTDDSVSSFDCTQTAAGCVPAYRYKLPDLSTFMLGGSSDATNWSDWSCVRESDACFEQTWGELTKLTPRTAALKRSSTLSTTYHRSSRSCQERLTSSSPWAKDSG